MASDEFENLLEELTNVGGPSGFEEPVRLIVERELESVIDIREIDGLGCTPLGSFPSHPLLPFVIPSFFLD